MAETWLSNLSSPQTTICRVSWIMEDQLMIGDWIVILKILMIYWMFLAILRFTQFPETGLGLCSALLLMALACMISLYFIRVETSQIRSWKFCWRMAFLCNFRVVCCFFSQLYLLLFSSLLSLFCLTMKTVQGSSLPPLINAMEVYTTMKMQSVPSPPPSYASRILLSCTYNFVLCFLCILI